MLECEELKLQLQGQSSSATSISEPSSEFLARDYTQGIDTKNKAALSDAYHRMFHTKKMIKERTKWMIQEIKDRFEDGTFAMPDFAVTGNAQL